MYMYRNGCMVRVWVVGGCWLSEIMQDIGSLDQLMLLGTWDCLERGLTSCSACSGVVATYVAIGFTSDSPNGQGHTTACSCKIVST